MKQLKVFNDKLSNKKIFLVYYQSDGKVYFGNHAFESSYKVLVIIIIIMCSSCLLYIVITRTDLKI